MKILSVNQSYNNKAQKTNQSKANTNFGAVLVKSHFELFEGRKTLSEMLLKPSGSRPNKITRLINKIRGVDETNDLRGELYYGQFPYRSQDIYLSDKETKEVNAALDAVDNAWEKSQEGKEWGEIDDYNKVINKLWEKPTGPVRTLRNLAEKLFVEGKKNPIGHVVTDCAAKLSEAQKTFGEAQRETDGTIHAALNGKKFPVPPEQLWLPTMKPKVRKSIKNGLGVEIVSWEE